MAARVEEHSHDVHAQPPHLRKLLPAPIRRDFVTGFRKRKLQRRKVAERCVCSRTEELFAGRCFNTHAAECCCHALRFRQLKTKERQTRLADRAEVRVVRCTVYATHIARTRKRLGPPLPPMSLSVFWRLQRRAKLKEQLGLGDNWGVSDEDEDLGGGGKPRRQGIVGHVSAPADA